MAKRASQEAEIRFGAIGEPLLSVRPLAKKPSVEFASKHHRRRSLKFSLLLRQFATSHGLTLPCLPYDCNAYELNHWHGLELSHLISECMMRQTERYDRTTVAS